MLSRLLPKSSHFRLLSNLSSKSHSYQHSPRISNSTFLLRHFSSNQNNNNNNEDQSSSSIWKLSSDEKFDSFFAADSKEGSLAGITDSPVHNQLQESWLEEEEGGSNDSKDIFQGIEKESAGGEDNNEWLQSEEYKMWNLDDAEDQKDHVFDIEEINADTSSEFTTESSANVEKEKTEEQKMLEAEEKELTAVLKGSNRAFGDLIAASGITDAMLDSLIALRDFEGVEGLPPLSEIEDMRYEKNTRKSTRADIERQKQEEVAKSRVRQVDEKGRAYGTGRRKCSVARVWIEPGDGKFIVNDKQFDVYFPMLDHRAALLRPFSETKTLGLWDVKCTVKGGGTTGQVGAIQLGISRAMQNWEPDLRPPLRNAGFLTRDPRVVERKKPGKAKARKSFQWVKR
ncbi:30S ribosomal protein S9, mitochondrial [Ricinus communis]|uniref:Ribosomal protein S9, putative n=1 Tax=Ricinus communis TaxID=3988 RepID=B9RIU9_RICCO|nr:30S ribosomal protein S9, mitochondrial [Ricinus communis]EEF49071.1 ribosomal protein S9, putative [Ricinus communis]|eukprot:XP_002513668.1 30S ribosomal protein S9, mitochondrial [Ricinus communis]